MNSKHKTSSFTYPVLTLIAILVISVTFVALNSPTNARMQTISDTKSISTNISDIPLTQTFVDMHTPSAKPIDANASASTDTPLPTQPDTSVPTSEYIEDVSG